MFGTPHGLNSSPASSAMQEVERFQQSLSAALVENIKDYSLNTNKAAAPAVAPTTTAAPAAAANDPAAPPVVAGGDSGDTPEVSPQEFDDAYWAKQPPAVQALRTMTDYDQRMNLVSQLTAQGYNIDVPIMAWGWDPAKVTAARQSYGYTWVPSAGQKPLAEAPGISLPGVEAYDPKKPPAHSMAV